MESIILPIIINVDSQRAKIAGIFILKVLRFLLILLQNIEVIGMMILVIPLIQLVILILVVIQVVLRMLHAGVVPKNYILSIIISDKKQTMNQLISLVLVMVIVLVTPMEIQLVEQEHSMAIQFQASLQHASHLLFVALSLKQMEKLVV